MILGCIMCQQIAPTPGVSMNQVKSSSKDTREIKRRLQKMMFSYGRSVGIFSVFLAIPVFVIGGLLVTYFSHNQGSAPLAIGLVFIPCALCFPVTATCVWRWEYRDRYKPMLEHLEASKAGTASSVVSGAGGLTIGLFSAIGTAFSAVIAICIGIAALVAPIVLGIALLVII